MVTRAFDPIIPPPTVFAGIAPPACEPCLETHPDSSFSGLEIPHIHGPSNLDRIDQDIHYFHCHHMPFSQNPRGSPRRAQRTRVYSIFAEIEGFNSHEVKKSLMNWLLLFLTLPRLNF